MRLDDCIRSLGGLAPTYRLIRQGWTKYQLSGAVRSGTIIRVRQGWYSVPEHAQILLSAARVGGRLTCSAGARLHGIWTRSATPPLHVAVSEHSSRLRDPSDYRRRLRPHSPVTVHWVARRVGTSFVADPLGCLLAMIACEPLEDVVAAADHALAMALISRRAWRAAIANQPLERQRLLDELDPASGSLPESVTRFRLARHGIRVLTQVQLAVDLRVDFVVGKSLVIEIDGSQHAGYAQYAKDRDRDARLSILGKRCLRFTGRQVLREWPTVIAAIEAAIARGDAE